jgi:hypothetical protein
MGVDIWARGSESRIFSTEHAAAVRKGLTDNEAQDVSDIGRWLLN